MEFQFFPFFLLISFFIFIFNLGKQSKIHNLPPGPKKLPFIGSLHLFFTSIPPQKVLQNLSKKHGPLMHIQLGQVGNVVVSSPKTAVQFLKTHDVVFASRPSLLASEISCYSNTDIAFAPYGDYWRQLRRICTLELLSMKRVRSFKRIREEEVLGLCKWIQKNEGSSVNLMERISMVNYDIMARAALGEKSGQQAEFVGVVKKSVEFFSVFRVIDVYPSLRFLHRLSWQRRTIQKLHDRSDRIITAIMERRKGGKADREEAEEEEGEEDFLDVLFRLQSDGSLEIPLTTDNIKAILAEMFGAGTVTSSNIVEWALAEMMKNPRVLKRAQEEVREVFDGKNMVVDESYFNELKYLKLVIKETLRLHPPAPLLLPRECRESCEINEYDIPVGTRVLINVWAMGRDPEFWEDAESFKPERFVDKPVDFRGKSYEYIPFGAGRKMCPGMTFGLANVETPLAMLLYYFDWILAGGMEGEELDMTEHNGVEPRKKYNLCAIPIVKRPLPN